MDRSDAELIEASWHDPEAFGEIFDRHYRVIYRFCARRIDEGRGEDVAGEVFRRAFERRRSYDLAHTDARPWLFTIALNLVRDALRSIASQQGAYQRFSVLAGTSGRDLSDQVASELDAQRGLVAVAAALELLPTDEVETLLLHVWEELTYTEVAEVLKIPVGTVRSRLNRLRQRLRALVEGSASHDAQLPTPPFGGSYD